MRSPGAIRHKLKQVIFRHLKKRLAAELDERPENCLYNKEVSLSSEGPVHICIHEDISDRVCDLRVGDRNRARTCPFFQVRRSKEEIKEDFRLFVNQAPLPEIAALYPDVAALMWVLEDDAPGRPDSAPEGWFEVQVGDRVLRVDTEEDVETIRRLQMEASEALESLRRVEAELAQVKEEREDLILPQRGFRAWLIRMLGRQA